MSRRRIHYWAVLPVASLIVALLALTSGTDGTTASVDPPDRRKARCSDSLLAPVNLPGAKLTGTAAVSNPGSATELTHPVGTDIDQDRFCEVEVALTHGRESTGDLPADDVHVWVWLPEKWNGRLQFIGGGGTRATNGPAAMEAALRNGYAVTASDSGISVENPRTNIFLEGDAFNWQLFENWSYRGVHDNAVVAKQVVAAYYHRKARYTYWNGCSNGGRQGLEIAQRFPDTFDGVLAAAPAIYGAERLNMTMSWPAYVQQDEFGDFIPTCKVRAMADAVRNACDGDDGVTDGLVSRPGSCDYEAALDSTVGTELPCGTITTQEVEIAKQVFQGPRTSGGRSVWYGYTPGTDVSGIMGHFDGWSLRNFVEHDPDWDWTSISAEELIEEYGPKLRSRLDILSSSDPVLEPFALSGGKLLMWHGLADGVFPADQSIRYYEEVRKLSGEETDDFFRLFLAPGVDHCGGGHGPAPEDPLASLVRWVEKGEAPDVLPAVQRDEDESVVRERDLCPYPEEQVYDGSGDPDDAAAFSCQEPAGS